MPYSGRLLPLGKWTREEIKEFSTGGAKTASEVDNQTIVATCGPALEKVFREYYERMGKRGYKFILSE